MAPPYVRSTTANPASRTSAAAAAGFSEAALQTLGPNVCRALCDRQYDIKKKGAKEIEKIVEFFQEKEIGVAREKTNTIIKLLVDDFLLSKTRDVQIGGVVALLGVARGLMGNSRLYLAQIIMPVMSTFMTAQEVALKYYTAECLYNLALIAPSDVVIFLEDLIEIDFKLWTETDTNLLRAAECTDSALLSLAHNHATAGQLKSLSDVLSNELQKKYISPPTFMLKWLDLLLTKSTQQELTTSYASPAASLIAMSGYKLQSEMLTSINVTLSRMAVLSRKNSETDSENWGFIFAIRLSVIFEDRSLNSAQQAQSTLNFLNTFCSGEQEVELVRENISWLLKCVLTVMRVKDQAVTNLAKNFMKKLQNNLAVIDPVSLRNDAMEIVCEELCSLLADPQTLENLAITEVLIEWLSVISRHNEKGGKTNPPDSCFRAIVGLTSHSRSEISRAAVECVAMLSAKDPQRSMEPLLASAVQRVSVARSRQELVTAMNLVHELLEMNGDVAAATLKKALAALPSTDLAESLKKQMTEICMITLIDVFRNGSYFIGDQAWGSSAESWLAYILVLQPTTQGLAYDRPCPWVWLVAQMELLILMLEMPQFARIRGSLVANIYPTIMEVLPVSSGAFEIARIRRDNQEVKGVPSDKWLKMQTANSPHVAIGNADLEAAKASIAEVLLPMIKEVTRQGFILGSRQPTQRGLVPPTASAAVLSWTSPTDVICQQTPDRKATEQLKLHTPSLSEPEELVTDSVTVDREIIKSTMSLKTVGAAPAEPNRSVDDHHAPKQVDSQLPTETPNSPQQATTSSA